MEALSAHSFIAFVTTAIFDKLRFLSEVLCSRGDFERFAMHDFTTAGGSAFAAALRVFSLGMD